MREAPDEVIVRGRRLTEMRLEIQTAREHAYDIFNAINSNDEFDVRCRDEPQIFTRVKRRVCRPRFEADISADAAHEYIAALRWVCQPSAGGQFNLTDCLFSDVSSAAVSAAQGIEGQAPPKRDAMNEEIHRLARENPQFAQAILDWYAASLEYDEALRRRADRR